MSTDQIDLTETIQRKARETRAQARQSLEGEGARYGQSVSEPDAETQPVPRCRGCDLPLHEAVTRVSESRARELSRVVGDNQGHVPACPECIPSRGNDVTSVVQAVHYSRGGQNR